MIDWAVYRVFLAASLALLLVPGPAVLYIVTRSMTQGRTAGIVSVLGISLGSLVHVVAAALGLSALLMSSALAFMIVKYLGAGYLIYLGLRTLFTKVESQEPNTVQKQALSRIFRQGIIVNILNPKTALFFFAFLPQFVDPTRGALAPQILFLGFTFILMGIMSDSCYALLAGTFGNTLRGNPIYLKAQRFIAGIVYLFLGATTALTSADNG